MNAKRGIATWTNWAAGLLILSSLSGGSTGTAQEDYRVTYQGEASVADGSTPPEGTLLAIGGFSQALGEGVRLTADAPPVFFPGSISGEVCTGTFCGSQNAQMPEFGTVEVTTYGSKPLTFFCGTQLCSSSFAPYFTAEDQMSCSGRSCGSFSTEHYARFGTVRGQVALRDGTPLPGREVIATDPEGLLPPEKAVTEDTGFYDFSREIAPIDRDNPAYGKTFPPVPINKDNQWGLAVYGDGGRVGESARRWRSNTRGKKDWIISTAGGAPQTVEVHSSDAAFVNFILKLPKEEKDKDDPDKQKCPVEGKPVSIATGNVFFSQTDATVYGFGQPWSFERTYNSQNAFHSVTGDIPVGPFGRGWSHSYSASLTFPSARRIVMRNDDGVPLHFTDPDGDGVFRAFLPATERSWITQTGDGYVHEFLVGGRETFNASGRLTSRTDPFGRTVRLEHDPNGLLTLIVAPGGRELRLTYQGFHASEILLSGPEGLIATYTVRGSVSRVEYADGSGYSFDYDERYQLLTMSDLSGRVVERHTYAEDKALTSEVGDGQEKYTFLYEPLKTTVTDGLGNVTTYEFTEILESKSLIRRTGPCSSCGTGESQGWTYDENGRVLTITNGLGHTTSYTYDGQGNQLTETNALGETTTWTYDGQGRVLTRTDPEGETTTFTHGPHGVTSIEDALGQRTEIAYLNGQLSSILETGDRLTALSYDAGDLVRVTDPLGASMILGYDGMGRVTRLVDAVGSATDTKYDALGKLRSANLPDGTSVEFGYDKGGRRTSTRDALGGTTRYLYDVHGRLETVVEPMGGITRVAYDPMSRVIGVTDPSGLTTGFGYDGFGRLIRVERSGVPRLILDYDDAGRLTSRTDGRGITSTYAYDRADRPTRKSFSDGTPAVDYSYDRAGRRKTAVSTLDSLAWTYDEIGQIKTESSSRNASTLSYTYDPSGRRLTLALNGLAYAGYTYDRLARLRELSHGAWKFEFEYDPASRRTGLIYPNGVEAGYEYDVRSRLTNLTLAAGNSEAMKLSYTHDALGNKLTTTTLDYEETYAYDAISRLLSADRTGSNPGQWEYRYDAVGNRVAVQDGDAVASLRYGEGNELLESVTGGDMRVRVGLDEAASVKVNGQPARALPGDRYDALIEVASGVNTLTVEASDASGNIRTNVYQVDVPSSDAAYEYDGSGNLVAKTEAGSVWRYEWDAENRLTRVERDGAEVARFLYDPIGRRIQKVAEGVTWDWLYDGEDILEERTSTGAKVSFVHGPGIDEPLASVDETGAAEFFHADALGTVIATTDSTGAMNVPRDLDPFGSPRAGADRSGYSFTGREWDPEIGLYYYRARYYDPKVGRFISEDPIGFEGGINLYVYVGNNPVTFVDASGLSDKRPVGNKSKEELRDYVRVDNPQCMQDPECAMMATTRWNCEHTPKPTPTPSSSPSPPPQGRQPDLGRVASAMCELVPACEPVSKVEAILTLMDELAPYEGPRCGPCEASFRGAPRCTPIAGCIK